MTDSQLTLTTRIEPRGPAGALVLTDEQVEQLGGGKRAAVRVTIGERTAEVRLAVMGGENLIGLSKASRAALGVEVGDEVNARIELDTAPREVVLPPVLDDALSRDPVARMAFAALAYSHRKEYATWVADAKREDTQTRRVAQAMAMLREGRTR